MFSFPAQCKVKLTCEQEVLLKKALSKVFKVHDPDSIEVLTGGFSSPGLYKIQIKNKSYVVRYAKLRNKGGKVDEGPISPSCARVWLCSLKRGVEMIQVNI